MKLYDAIKRLCNFIMVHFFLFFFFSIYDALLYIVL